MILGFQGTTLVNFPHQVASVIFLSDCNLHCPYCYNKSLVYPNRNTQPLSKDYILHELEDRKDFITGVCITGGEPTLYHFDLINLLEDIKKTVPNLLIKVDTNGTRPDVVANLIDTKLVDYIAMDYKTAPSEYKGLFSKYDIDEAIIESMNVIRTKLTNENFEFRITTVRGLYNSEIAKSMARYLSKDDTVYIQNFKYYGEENHINIKMFDSVDIAGFNRSEIEEISEPITKKCNNVYFRNF